MQPSLDRDFFVIRRGGIEPSVGQSEDAGEEPEDPRERKVKGGFGENAPGEDKEDSYDGFDDGKEPPSCDVGDGQVSRTGLRSFEELGGHTVLKESPTTEDFTQKDGDECDGVFEARAIVDRLGVLIYHEQADCGRSDRDWDVSVHARERKEG